MMIENDTAVILITTKAKILIYRGIKLMDQDAKIMERNIAQTD